MSADPMSCTTNYKEGIDRVLSGDYAFIGEGAWMEYYTNTHCDLTIIGQPLNSINYAIAVPKGNKLKAVFISQIIQISLKMHLIQVLNTLRPSTVLSLD